MPIPNPDPIVLPPSDQKEFNHIWLLQMRVKAPDITQGTIMIEYYPYNGNTGEIYKAEGPKRLYINNLWQAVNEVPEAAAAMNAVFAAVHPILLWQQSLGQEPSPSEESSPSVSPSPSESPSPSVSPSPSEEPSPSE